jgi:type II secretory pathway component PulJ
MNRADWLVTRRGFTLIEGVFSMFLIFLVLGALTYTLQQAGNVKSNLRNMGELSEIVQVMSLLRADAAAAIDVTEPTASSVSSELELNRIDPHLFILDRIDLSDDFDPFEPSEEAEVRYFADSGLLKRAVTSAAGRATVERLIPVLGFQAEREPGPDTLTVTFEITNSRRTRKHTMKVALK